MQPALQAWWRFCKELVSLCLDMPGAFGFAQMQAKCIDAVLFGLGTGMPGVVAQQHRLHMQAARTP